MSSWYSIKNSSRSDRPEYRISIHDDIGLWGVTARTFIEEFNAIPADAAIKLHVHSGGGDVFEALAMYHVLAPHSARITAHIDGLAASAASLIIMAAGSIEIPENAYLMIHNPISYTGGDHDDLRGVADLVENLRNSFAAIYAARTGRSQEDVQALMKATTWMNGAEAVAAGFADVMLESLAAVACLSPAELAKHPTAPQALIAPAAPETLEAETNPAAASTDPETEALAATTTEEPAPVALAADQVADLCAAAGLADITASLIRTSATADQVSERINAAKAIRVLASAAKMPSEGESMIRAGINVEDARKILMTAKARLETEILSARSADSQHKPPEKPSAGLDINQIYSRRLAATKTA